MVKILMLFLIFLFLNNCSSEPENRNVTKRIENKKISTQSTKPKEIVYPVEFPNSEASKPEILAQFFGQSGIKNKNAVYHGEMLEYYSDKPTMGEGLPGDVQYKFRKLNETEKVAVYAVLLINGQQTQDWYAFLVKENQSWKLSAIRTLALPGMFYMTLNELKKKNTLTKEEEWQYQNMLLTIKSDRDLKDYLKKNISDFKNVISLLSKDDKETAELEAKKLYINFIKVDDRVVEFNLSWAIFFKNHKMSLIFAVLLPFFSHD